MIGEYILEEMFGGSLKDKKLRDFVTDKVKSSDIPTALPHHRLFLSYLVNAKDKNLTPTLGAASEYLAAYSRKDGYEKILKKVEQKCESYDKNTRDTLKESVLEYIRRTQFVTAMQNANEKYNKKDVNGAVSLIIEESERILKETSAVTTDHVFEKTVFEKGKDLLENGTDYEYVDLSNVRSGIDPLHDNIGYLEKGSSFCWVAETGAGKSTVLRWEALYNALIGNDVLFISLEGSKNEVVQKFIAMITGIAFQKVVRGDIEPEIAAKAVRVLDGYIRGHKRIYVEEITDYEKVTTADLRGYTDHYYDMFGKYPDLICLDYIDLVYTGNWKIDNDPNMKKHRLSTVGHFFKVWATATDSVVMTAAQTRGLDSRDINNLKFVITKDMTEGDRTMGKPFTHMVSVNISDKESKHCQARLFLAKTRHSKGRKLIHICTDYDRGRFYAPLREPIDLSEKKKKDDIDTSQGI